MKMCSVMNRSRLHIFNLPCCLCVHGVYLRFGFWCVCLACRLGRRFCGFAAKVATGNPRPFGIHIFALNGDNSKLIRRNILHKYSISKLYV